MLDSRQVTTLAAIGAVFWLADIGWIRLVPILVVDPFWGGVGDLLSIPVAWICVRFGRDLAKLDAIRLVPGIALMVLVASLLHGVALRWAPSLYGDDHAARLGGAWLLWIYGLILGFALLAARRARGGPAPK